MTDVAGKVSLVTGGAMGMGKMVAARLARDGARVILWDVNRDEMDKTLDELRTVNEDVCGYVVDVTDPEAVNLAAGKVRDEIGAVDILVNNAGIVAGGDFLDVPIEEHLRVMEVNINAVMICTYAFLPGMKEKKSGHIVNMASAAGLMGVPGVSGYCASKFAVVGFTEALGMELRKAGLKNIRTTVVCPSFVGTGMFEGVRPPMFAPMLHPPQMADMIYEGLRRNKKMIKAPTIVKFVPLMKALLTPDAFAAVTESTGTHKSMDTWKGRKN